MDVDIAKNWKELSGEKDWNGLLSPLDTNLRHCIIHYGERVQAIYDSFNGDEAIGMYGFPRYAPEDFFSNVGLENGNPYKYTVTNYFYARSVIDCPKDWVVKDQSAWIGYVAVATDEGKAALGRRDILISWRGTLLAAEWFKNFNFALTSASDIFGGSRNPKVHRGFHSLYTSSATDAPYNVSSARDQVLKALRALLDKYKDEEISITLTGHSLGGALATLNAADIVANGYNKPTDSDKTCMVTAFVYASPKVGDINFKLLFNGLSNLHLLHIRNNLDIVPKLPFIFYSKVGTVLKIDTTKSTYVKPDITYPFDQLPSIWHNLENYLHVVAGTQEKGTFNLVIKRDIALVNKQLDLLKFQYGVPPKWWQPVLHKSMVQHDDGSWKVEYYVPELPMTVE